MTERLTPTIRQELDLAGWEARGLAQDVSGLDALAARLARRIAVVLTTPPGRSLTGEPS